MIGALPPAEPDPAAEKLWSSRRRRNSTGIAIAILWPVISVAQAVLLASYTYSVYSCSRLDDAPRSIVVVLIILGLLVVSALSALHLAWTDDDRTLYRSISVGGIVASLLLIACTLGLILGAVALSPESVRGPAMPLRIAAASAVIWPPIYSLAILLIINALRRTFRGSKRPWLFGLAVATLVLGGVAGGLGLIYDMACA
jgi:hypothetical protein